MFKLLRSLLFCFNPEFSHRLILWLLRFSHFYQASLPGQPVKCFGLTFQNCLGLAAGFDKDGQCINGLLNCGFGFIELGTVTPKAQVGNPKPRLFRVKSLSAIVNKMGFNNRGVAALVKRIHGCQRNGVIGVNVGKNKNTHLMDAQQDYVMCLRAAADVADYFVVNLSSPNTPGLRELQTAAYLEQLLTRLLIVRDELQLKYHKSLPLLVKLSPDLSDEELTETLAIIKSKKIDGIVATNTTVDYTVLKSQQAQFNAGGVSGRPLFTKSLSMVKKIREAMGPSFPIIAVGGISSGADAVAMLEAGADLLQVYTALIYQGPALIKDILVKIQDHENKKAQSA